MERTHVPVRPANKGDMQVASYIYNFTIVAVIVLCAAIVLWGCSKRKHSDSRSGDSSGSAPASASSAPADTAESRDDEERLVSVVLLLARPRELDAQNLGVIAARVFGAEFNVEGDESHFVVGESSMFIIKADDRMFIVHNWAKGYFEDPTEVADTVEDPACRIAIRRHKAWLSVDLIGMDDTESLDTAYPQIAQLVGALADDSVLAVFCPDSERIRVCEGDFKDRLTGPAPMQALGSMLPDPLFLVSEDDPEMQAAAAEARRRWPEFAQAFRTNDGELFSVKAPFVEGDQTEFLWVQMLEIKGDTIAGKIGNDPVCITGLKLGSPVEIQVRDLTDWMYLKADEPQGGFQMKVIMKHQSERSP